jgi:carboxylate-amine ligase
LSDVTIRAFRVGTFAKETRKMSASRLLTIGVEEEFFVVNAVASDCVLSLPKPFLDDLQAELGPHVRREILGSMVETATGVHSTVAGAVAEAAQLRQGACAVARRHGLALMAAGTHPFADPKAQRLTRKPRYRTIARETQTLIGQMHVCGLHVHAGVPDIDQRIDLMNRVQRFMPLFLALSASSPFRRGAPAGVASYRMAAWASLPHSGFPGRFANGAEYLRYVEKLRGAGFIEDASYLWWAVRPSAKYPTLEMRIADSCPFIGDVGALAALYVSLLRRLLIDQGSLREWEHHHPLIDRENVWQAIRHGREARFLDPVSGEAMSATGLARNLTSFVVEDARALGCLDELLCVADVIVGGTGADRQIEIYAEALAQGADRREAARRVAAELTRITARPWREPSPAKAESAKAA